MSNLMPSFSSLFLSLALSSILIFLPHIQPPSLLENLNTNLQQLHTFFQLISLDPIYLYIYYYA